MSGQIWRCNSTVILFFCKLLQGFEACEAAVRHAWLIQRKCQLCRLLYLILPKLASWTLTCARQEGGGQDAGPRDC